jgi:carbon-monoxide dehydrogenase small subunit
VEGIFIINGREEKLTFNSKATLLAVLRDNGHTEVKMGCGTGECGACIVLLDGMIVNSCQVLAASAMRSEIVTSKGLGTIHSPHPIHRAFVEAGAVQCGFCTPGMILVTYYLLKKYPKPTDEQIRRVFNGSLCRCTGYVKIVEAVKLASERMAHEG